MFYTRLFFIDELIWTWRICVLMRANDYEHKLLNLLRNISLEILKLHI